MTEQKETLKYQVNGFYPQAAKRSIARIWGLAI
jgi:hypothetical protein